LTKEIHTSNLNISYTNIIFLIRFKIFMGPCIIKICCNVYIFQSCIHWLRMNTKVKILDFDRSPLLLLHTFIIHIKLHTSLHCMLKFGFSFLSWYVCMMCTTLTVPRKQTYFLLVYFSKISFWLKSRNDLCMKISVNVQIVDKMH